MLGAEGVSIGMKSPSSADNRSARSAHAGDSPPPQSRPASLERPPLSLLVLSVALFLMPLLGGTMEDLRPGALRVLLLAAALLRALESRQPGGDAFAPRAPWPVTLFAGWALLTAVTGTNLYASFNALHFLGAGLLTYLLVADAVRLPSARAWLFGGVLGGASVAAAWAIREYLLTFRADPTWRVFGPFQGPNLLADYLLPCLFLGLAGVLVGRRPWLMAVAFGTLLCAAALVLTGSRGAVVYALPVAFVAWAALSHRALDPSDPARVRSQRFRLVAILLAGLALGALFLKPTATRVGASASAGESSSSQFRILTWRGTLALIRERPVLGFGPGAWEAEYPRVAMTGYTRAAHNGYLQTAAEMGLPGLALWLAVVVTGVWPRRRVAPLSSKACMADAGRIAALVGLALHNGVDYGWLLFGPAVLTWALLAARPPREDAGSSPGAQRAGWSVGALALVLTLAGLPAAYAEMKEMEAETALAERNPVLAVQEYAAAAAADPTEWRWPREEARLSLYALHDPKAAIARYQEALRLSPRRAVLWHGLGRAYAQANDADAAANDYEAALRYDPNATPPLMDYARLEEGRGRSVHALSLYRRIAAIQESSAGRVRALADLEDPNYVAARLALAEDAMKRGALAEARRHVDAGLRSAEAYLYGMKTWRKVLEVENRYRPDEEAQVRAARDRFRAWGKRLGAP